MNEWDRSLKKLDAEVTALLLKKRALEQKLSLVQQRIDTAIQAAVIIEKLAGYKPSISGAIGETIADKIRHILLRSETPLTAVEIKDQLAGLGFTFPGDPRPVATIHAICHRLTTARKPLVEVTPFKKDGRRAWQRAHRS